MRVGPECPGLVERGQSAYAGLDAISGRPLINLVAAAILRPAHHPSLNGDGIQDISVRPLYINGSKGRFMLQIIFGDDEHTAADGTYTRVMKTRKWLYMSSAASLIVSLGFYDASSATDLVKVVKLPTTLVAPSLAFGVTYLLIQYGFLLGQLISTYDIVLKDRFIFRRADELSSARERMVDARQKLSASIAEFRRSNDTAFNSRERELAASLQLEDDLLAAAEKNRINLERRKSPDEHIALARHDEGRRKALRAVAANHLKKLRDDRPGELQPDHDPNVRMAELALEDCERAFLTLQRQVPSERTGYQLAERLIDFSRILPPLAFAALALLHYWHIWPFTA